MESFISPYNSPDKQSSSESNAMLPDQKINHLDNGESMVLNENCDFPGSVDTADNPAEDLLSKGDFVHEEKISTQDFNNRETVDLNSKMEFQDTSEVLLPDNHNAQGDIESNSMQMTQSTDQISEPFLLNDNQTVEENMANNNELHTYESATANAYFTANENASNTTNHISDQNITQENNFQDIPTATTANLNIDHSNTSHSNNEVVPNVTEEVFEPGRGQSTDDDTENRPPSNDYLQEMVSSAGSDVYESLPSLNLTINSPIHSSVNSPRSSRRLIHPSGRSKSFSESKETDSVEHFLTINTDLSKFKDLTINVDFNDQEMEKDLELKQSSKILNSPKCEKLDLTLSINLSATGDASLASSHDCNMISRSSTNSLRSSTASTDIQSTEAIKVYSSDSLSINDDGGSGSSPQSLSDRSENGIETKNSSLLSNVFLMDDDPFLNSETSLCEDYFIQNDVCQMGDVPMELKDPNFTYDGINQKISNGNLYETEISTAETNFGSKAFGYDVTRLSGDITESTPNYLDPFNFGCENLAESNCEIDLIAPFQNIAYCASYSNNETCDDLLSTNLAKSDESMNLQSNIARELFNLKPNLEQHEFTEINNSTEMSGFVSGIKLDDKLSPHQSLECTSSGSDTTVKPSTSNEKGFLTESYSSYSDPEIPFRRLKDRNLNQEDHRSCIDFGQENVDLNNIPKPSDLPEMCNQTYNSYAEIYSLNRKLKNNIVPSIEFSNKSPIVPLNSTESTSTVSTVKTSDFSGASDETGSSDSYSVDFSAPSLLNIHSNSSGSHSGFVERNLQVELPFFDQSSRSSIDTDYCRYFNDNSPSSSSENLPSVYQPSFVAPSNRSDPYDFEYTDKVGSSMQNLVSTCQSVVKALDNIQTEGKPRKSPNKLDLDELKELVAKNEDSYFADDFKMWLNTSDITLGDDQSNLNKSSNNNPQLFDNISPSLNNQIYLERYSDFNSTVCGSPISSHYFQRWDHTSVASQADEDTNLISKLQSTDSSLSTLPTDRTHFYVIHEGTNDHSGATAVENSSCPIGGQPNRITSEDVKNLPTFIQQTFFESKKSEENLSESCSDNKISEFASKKFGASRLKQEVKNTQSHNSFFKDIEASSNIYHNLTNSEMMSVSQKMEKEFREMLIQEKKNTKNQNGGTSSSQLQAESKKEVLQKKKSPLTSQTGQNRTPKTLDIKPRRSLAPPKTITNKKKLIPVTTLHLTPPVKSPTHKKFPSKLTTTPKRAIPVQRTGSAPVLGNPRRVCTPTTIRRVTPNSPDPIPKPITSPRRKVDVKTPIAKHYKYQRPLSATSTSSFGSVNSANSTPNRQQRMPEHLRNVKSKTGSMNNINHTPSGGNVKIESKKANYQGVTSKCGSKDNQYHTPGGGNVKIESKRSSFTGVAAKCGSVANIHYKPGGGNIKIESKKLDFSHVSSKCGSKDNIKHTPKGGNVKVESKRADLSHVKSKCGSKDNQHHTPGGGKIKIESKRLNFDKVTSKCGSTDNIKHKPQGGNVKVESKRADLSHVKSKCGSKDNQHHTPGGGKIKIESKRLNFDKVTSKCGSTDNIKHKPQGGNVQIFSETPNFIDVTSKVGSKDNIHHTPKGGNATITHSSLDLSNIRPKVGSRDQIDHIPTGGNVRILNKGLNMSNVQSKCGSLDNTKHVAGGGDVMIFDEKLAFGQAAQSKVGSLDNAQHTPGGGNVAILNDKLSFRQSANARTDSGINMSSTSSES